MRQRQIARKRFLMIAVLAVLTATVLLSGCSSPGAPGRTAEAAPSPAAPSAPAPSEMPSAAPTPEPPAGNNVTMSISCASILDHMDWLDPDKADLIPEDGWILEPVTVELQEGESVFDLLLRVTREHKIHMEYSQAPLYGSAYIEGIANLYEFDCGAVSGWMYAVNDWYPNYGCSGYALEPGDRVEWHFTCDGGEDIGGGYQQQE